MVPGLKHAFPQAFKQTDHNFLRIAGRTAVADGSGACVCLACICGPDQDGQLHILTANVGDSRCVLVKTEGVERLTRDHKPNDPEEKKRVEGVGGPGVVAEVQGIWRVLLAKKGIVQAGLAVSRAFGDLELKKPKELVTAVPEVKAYEVDFDEDEGLVLATDGLWDVLSDEDAARIVLQHASEGPTGCSKALVQAAKKRGSPDDITAQVILFKWRGHSAPEKAAEDDEEKDDAADEDDENDDDEDDDDDDDALTAEVKKTVRDAEKADEFLADEDETANREGFLRAASKSADEMVANAAKAAGMKDASAAAAEDSDDEEDGFKAALAAGSAKAVSQEDLDDIFG
jgi:serine/threonine protein phosphatase PrpC